MFALSFHHLVLDQLVTSSSYAGLRVRRVVFVVLTTASAASVAKFLAPSITLIVLRKSGALGMNKASLQFYSLFTTNLRTVFLI
jgi:hypothetical protein